MTVNCDFIEALFFSELVSNFLYSLRLANDVCVRRMSKN